MKPHPRIRKTVKWGGAVVCVLSAGLWVWSTRQPSSTMLMPGHMVALTNAGVHIAPAAAITPLNPHPGNYRIALSVHDWYRPSNPVWDVRWHHDALGWLVFFPLWIPLVASVATTAIAWRLDTLVRRRARIGFCPKCDYDRTGLAAGAVCPECGKGANR